MSSLFLCVFLREFANNCNEFSAIGGIKGLVEPEQRPSTAWSTDLIAVESQSQLGV